MIDGAVKAPLFDVGNEKIVLRHILASSLAFFFRKNPSLFKDINALVYEDGMKEFKGFLSARPEDLGRFADEVILKGVHLDYLKNFRWIDEVMKTDSRFTLFLSDVMGKMKRMENARDVASKNKDFQMAGYFEGQINRMKKESVIQLLSENAVIPKYGFPVDVVDLNVIGELVQDKNYNLTRDLSIAISEYAPGSEVIVSCRGTIIWNALNANILKYLIHHSMMQNHALFVLLISNRITGISSFLNWVSRR